MSAKDLQHVGARTAARRHRARRHARLRRGFQVASLLTFAVLLFWVAWPYSARPAQIWPGWMPVELDLQRGRVTLVRETPSTIPQSPPHMLYVVDEGARPPVELGLFRVVGSGQQELTLAAADPLTPAELERLGGSIGPWSLHEDRPGNWPSHYSDDLAGKERLPAESFLMIDPLVSLATGVASGQWGRTALWAAAILLVCLLVPRGFCGYLCPLGTLIDLFDWTISRRVPWPRAALHGRWATVKFLILIAILGASAAGLLVASFFSAIPLITRGLVCSLAPLLNGLLRGLHQVQPPGSAEIAAILLLIAVLALGLLRPRFWCRHLCPTGAIFALGNLLALSRRRVNEDCLRCGRCATTCPFGAIGPEQPLARVTDCVSCRTCMGTCPSDAVEFALHWRTSPRPPLKTLPPAETTADRRAARREFLATATSVAAAALGGGMMAMGAQVAASHSAVSAPLRPPGSLPEELFVRLCVRCGACYQACPNGALRPLGIEGGLETLWTPQVVANRAGCEPSCNRCGQVCPTRAIRPLKLEQKRATPIGRAKVDLKTCLPYAGKAECKRCVDECAAAGYQAIEFVRIGTEMDASGQPVEDSGFLAPVVLGEKCVGCGMCQNGCYTRNVANKGILRQPAIVVEAIGARP